MTKILPLTAIPKEAQNQVLRQAAQIFFETAHIKVFDSILEQEAFYQRWFGHYLDADPGAFLIAVDKNGAAIGYLAGCLDSFSKNASAIVEDIAFYTPDFFDAIRAYPSHLHINVKPGHQGQGVGSLLMQRYFELCRDKGSSGIHVVTDATSRAVRFYRRCGFTAFMPPGADPDLALLVRALPA